MSSTKEKTKRGRPVVHNDLSVAEAEALRVALDEDPLLPESVKTVRNALGLTQATFGAKCGASKRTVQDWEAGLRACKGAWRLQVIGLSKKVKPI